MDNNSTVDRWLSPQFFNPDSASYISAATIESIMQTNGMVTLFLTSSYGKHGTVSINANVTAPAGHTNLWIIQASDFIMDIKLNAVVDFSASTGQFRIGSTSTPANSIQASSAGKIIGNTGFISLDALTVGDASNPIRVEVVPDSDATTSNFLLCANYGVCSDTGTRITVPDQYVVDSQAFRDHVFVSVSLRDGHTFTPPPTTPPAPEPPVVDPPTPVGPKLPLVREEASSLIHFFKNRTKENRYGSENAESSFGSDLTDANKFIDKRSRIQTKIVLFEFLESILVDAPKEAAGKVARYLFNWTKDVAKSEIADRTVYRGMDVGSFAEIAREKADNSVNSSFSPSAAYNLDRVNAIKSLGAYVSVIPPQINGLQK